MRKYIQRIFFEICYYMELFISAILFLVIVGLAIKLLMSITEAGTFSQEDAINVYLGKAMSLAVGVEFIKMLCKHTPNTVIEVLLFAIARQMIVGHGSIVDTVIGVVAIAILFATRKFLLCEFDETEKTVYRASMSIKMLNMIAKIHIPHEDGDTLRDVVVNKLTSDDKSISVGACVYYKEFALRIANMHGDVITRVEVIKSI